MWTKNEFITDDNLLYVLGEDEQTDMDFLIAHSKKLVNIPCRICKQNKTGAVYDVY